MTNKHDGPFQDPDGKPFIKDFGEFHSGRVLDELKQAQVQVQLYNLAITDLRPVAAAARLEEAEAFLLVANRIYSGTEGLMTQEHKDLIAKETQKTIDAIVGCGPDGLSA